MSLAIWEVYVIRGYKDPLCFAISDDFLVTKVPQQKELIYLKEGGLPCRPSTAGYHC